MNENDKLRKENQIDRININIQKVLEILEINKKKDKENKGEN